MLFSPIICGLMALASATPASATPSKPRPKPGTIEYSVVTSVFLQDEPTTNPATFNFTATNFGLIERSYPTDKTVPNSKKATQWQRLAHYIKTLNRQSKQTERYALLFLARHGEGYHNAAETYFGTPAWNCYWAPRDGNGTHTWADAHLTPTGEEQALVVNRFWKHLIKNEKITTPESYYSSPMYRCLATADLTFGGLDLPKKSPYKPIVKEYFREGINAHTCNRRSNKKFLAESFPNFRFEKGFPEEDPHWIALHGETRADQDIRSKEVLDDVFTTDKKTYISVSSHSGEISSLLRVLGHREFRLATGSALPVLVKVTTLEEKVPTPTTSPQTTYKNCATPPPIRDSSCNDCSCCS